MEGHEVRDILAGNIKRLRENRRLSQADLAFEAGISIPFLSDIERGNKWPSPETVAKIASALQIALFELFIPADMKPLDNSVLISLFFNEITEAQTVAARSVLEKYVRFSSVAESAR